MPPEIRHTALPRPAPCGEFRLTISVVVKLNALVFQYAGREITLFAHGRMLIKGVSSEQEAIEVYRKIMDKVGKRPGRYA